MKKISIVIPCYNSENYISICIDGLKKQLFDDVEFIFVNDGSTDHTLNYIKKFEREDDRVVVIDKPNEGVSKARNDALMLPVVNMCIFWIRMILLMLLGAKRCMC